MQLPFYTSDDVCRSIRNVKFLNQGFYNMRCFVMFVTAVCFQFLLKLKWPKNKSSDHLSEPDKLSKISQVLEKSQENFAVRLTLSFSKQLVSHISVCHRYVFSAFQNAQNIFCYQVCKPSPKGRHAKGQPWQDVASSCMTILRATLFSN